ncbi:4253_t:CDS:2, partial [Dentiscutata erythropus]
DFMVLSIDEVIFTTIYEEITSSTNKASSVIVHEGINQLHEYLIENGYTITAFEYNKYWAVNEYLVLLEDGHKKEIASQEAAYKIYITPKPYTAKRICFLAKYIAMQYKCLDTTKFWGE